MDVFNAVRGKFLAKTAAIQWLTWTGCPGEPIYMAGSWKCSTRSSPKGMNRAILEEAFQEQMVQEEAGPANPIKGKTQNWQNTNSNVLYQLKQSQA